MGLSAVDGRIDGRRKVVKKGVIVMDGRVFEVLCGVKTEGVAVNDPCRESFLSVVGK
jgi:hypothetical protein